MPTLKLERVVSFSSEDPSYPAINLLEIESYKKWKCKSAGEPEAVVILQLEQPTLISGLDIGNEGAAFIEVLVGRQSSDEFKVLLVASSFMSPMESKNGTNKNRVRMFSKIDFCKPVADEKWDRVKVVCRQPFNRYLQYGLCFVTFYSPEEAEVEVPAPKPVKPITPVKPKDTIGSYQPGFLFARHKQLSHDDEPLTGAAAIRAASRPEALVQKPDLKKKKVLEDLKKNRNSPSPQAHSSSDKPNEPKIPRRKFLLSPSSRSVDKPGTTKTPKADDRNTRNGLKRPSSSERNSFKKVKVDDKKVLKKPFNKLLDGVVFVISGYQNPERGNVRSMALEMGAKYKPDWDNSCTHLVCAFMNTPKYQQVHGRGRIIRKEWIEQCHSRRARLPWRRHALDKREQNKPESEDEILEEVPRVPEPSPAYRDDSDSEPGVGSGSDTEEEIERVRTAAKNCITDSDTEIDEPDKPPDTSSLPFPSLPNAFENKSFYLRPEEHRHQKLITRHIVANGGCLLSTDAKKVDYIVSDESPDRIKEEFEQWPSATIVNYLWVIDKLKLKLND